MTKMWQVDEKALSKKYRTNVGRLIRAWKHGITDQEITVKTGIAPVTLHLIKQDIELTHRHIRLAQKIKAGEGSVSQPETRFLIFAYISINGIIMSIDTIFSLQSRQMASIHVKALSAAWTELPAQDAAAWRFTAHLLFTTHVNITVL